MPDSLFYIVIALAIGAYLVGVSRRRRALLEGLPKEARGMRRGPVPGYSYLPGQHIRWDPNDRPVGLGEGWQPVSLETLHAGSRTRLVLTVRGKDLDAPTMFTVMKVLASRIQRRSGAAVVAVLVVEDGFDEEPRGVLVYAPDGRGWTGTTSEAVITARLPDRDAFRRAA